jgi:hypothetical protein
MSLQHDVNIDMLQNEGQKDILHEEHNSQKCKVSTEEVGDAFAKRKHADTRGQNEGGREGGALFWMARSSKT